MGLLGPAPAFTAGPDIGRSARPEAARAALAPLAQRLATFIAKQPRAVQIGVSVLDVADGSIVFEHQADIPLKPASVQKLAVTAAALDCFGPQFHYATRLYLVGNELWVLGSGDPALGDERIAERLNQPRDQLFDVWASALRQRGVAQLTKIVLDDTIFDMQYRHPDWPIDQAERWYQAPVGGLNLNDNCLDVSVRVNGRSMDLMTMPPLPAELLVNELRIVKRGRAGASLRRDADSDIFTLKGALRGAASFESVAAGRPPVFFGHALLAALQERGVGAAPQLTRRAFDPVELAAQTPLATHVTPLPLVLWRCNTFSQNLFAECLLKSLAAFEPSGRPRGAPGSFAGGAATALQQLQRLGLNTAGVTIRDGAGLSHQNRMPAGFVSRLLVRMNQHPHAAVFRASLAVPGQEGSMRKRFNKAPFLGRVIGKTGSIKGVSTLAGYARTAEGRELAFTFFVSEGDDALPDKLCQLLLTP